MSRSAKEMPAGTDGKAHLFFDGNESVQLMAVSTTGCIAIESRGNPIRVFHWYYRMKGSEFITLPPAAWLILYSCRAPWNTESCGHITRLHVSSCGLMSIDARELTRLSHLNCAGNRLERLDCSGMERLQSLDCSGNDLTIMNVDGCVMLKRLRIGGNPSLRENTSELLTRATGQPGIIRRTRLTSLSLFDL